MIDANTPNIHGKKGRSGEKGFGGSEMEQLAYFGGFLGGKNMENTPLCDIVAFCNIDRHAYKRVYIYKKDERKNNYFLFSICATPYTATI